jgi:hypothetical protein
MIRSLGKVVMTFEPGSLFAGLEVELPAAASEIRIPEPTESVDPGQIATRGPEEERPPKEAKQPGEQNVAETVTASARAVSSPASRAPAGPAAERSGCGQAPDIHSLDPDELERRRALRAVAAGESICPEAMRDLVGVGFVHITTSRRVVTEEAMAWLESLGDGDTVGRAGDAAADAVSGAATSGTDVTAGETTTASAFVSDYPDIPEFLRRAPANKPLSAP